VPCSNPRRVPLSPTPDLTPAPTNTLHLERRDRFTRVVALGAGLLAAALAAQSELGSPELRSRLEALDRGTTSTPATLQRGSEVYLEASCNRCHGDSPGQAESALGPSLANLLFRYSAIEVLQHIVDPGLFVAPRYRTTVVELARGLLREGLLIDESDTHLVLMPNALEPALLHRVEKSYVVRRDELALSPMPDNLLSPFSEEDIVCLVAFLLETKPD
jgi:putative heme-binding domain-containing protein